jgi:hypothetical protein
LPTTEKDMYLDHLVENDVLCELLATVLGLDIYPEIREKYVYEKSKINRCQQDGLTPGIIALIKKPSETSMINYIAPDSFNQLW